MRGRLIALLIAGLLAVVALPASAQAAGTASGTAVAGGWAKTTSAYIGKYVIAPVEEGSQSPSATAPDAAAGLFSVAVRAAEQLSGAGGPVSSGALDTFLRKVKSGEPLSPSGILTLYGSSGTQILYLTDMALRGTRRVATVNGGSFLGDPIGTFSGSVNGGVFDAVITASGLGTAHVRLIHFVPTPPSS